MSRSKVWAAPRWPAGSSAEPNRYQTWTVTMGRWGRSTSTTVRPLGKVQVWKP